MRTKDLTIIAVIQVCFIAFWIFVGYMAAENKVYRGCADTQSVEMFGYQIQCSIRSGSQGYPIGGELR